MNMKYIMSNERKEIIIDQGQKVVLYRIVSLRDFTAFALKRKVKYEEGNRIVYYQIEEKPIRVGQKGGFVQSLKNLSQEGSCWIDDDAFACGQSLVEDDAYLGDHAAIGDRVRLSESTKVTDFVQLGGSMQLCGKSKAIGSGSYKDEKRFRDTFIGKDIVQNPKPISDKKISKYYEKPLGGKIKIECQIDGKKIVNDFEF